MLLPLVVIAGAFAQADGSVVGPINAGLIQIQGCLELQAAQCASTEITQLGHVNRGMGGLSVQALVSTLGIGLLSLVCFVPTALLAEMWMRRNNKRGKSDSQRRTG